MALTVVSINDTINTFRLKTNELSANVGDRGNLSNGIANANLVTAINFVYQNANTSIQLIGDLGQLDGDILSNANLVAAINYVWANIDQGVYVVRNNGQASNLSISNANIIGGTFTNANIFGRLVVSNVLLTNVLTTNNVSILDNVIYFHTASTGTYLAWDASLNAFRLTNNQSNIAYISNSGHPISENSLITFKFANTHLGTITNARLSNTYISNANLFYANINQGNLNGIVFTDNTITFGGRSGANIYFNPSNKSFEFFHNTQTSNLYNHQSLIDQNTIIKVGLANTHYLTVNNSITSNITILGANVRNLAANDNTYHFYTQTHGTKLKWEPFVATSLKGFYRFDVDDVDVASITYDGFPKDSNTLVTTKHGNVNYVTTVGNQNQIVTGIKTFNDRINSRRGEVWFNDQNDSNPTAFIQSKYDDAGFGNVLMVRVRKDGTTDYFTSNISGVDGTFYTASNLHVSSGQIVLQDDFSHPHTSGSNHLLKANTLSLYYDSANIITEPFGNIIYVTTTREQTVSGVKRFNDTLVLQEDDSQLWLDPKRDGSYPLFNMGNVGNNVSFALQKNGTGTNYFAFTMSADTGNFAVPGNIYSQYGALLLDDGTKARRLQTNVIGLYYDGANIVTQPFGNLIYLTTGGADQVINGVKRFNDTVVFQEDNSQFWLDPKRSGVNPLMTVGNVGNNVTFSLQENGTGSSYYAFTMYADTGNFAVPGNLYTQTGVVQLSSRTLLSNTRGLYFDGANVITQPYGNLIYLTTGGADQTINGVKRFNNTVVFQEPSSQFWLDPKRDGTNPLMNVGNVGNNVSLSLQKNGTGTNYFAFTMSADTGNFAVPGNIYSQYGVLQLDDGTKVRSLRANVRGLYFDDANVVIESVANVNYVSTTRYQNVFGTKHFVDSIYHTNPVAFTGRNTGNAIYWSDSLNNLSPSIFSSSLNNLTLDVNSSGVSSNILLAAKTVYAPYILLGAQQLVKTVGGSIVGGSLTIDLRNGNIYEVYMGSSISSITVTGLQGNSGYTAATGIIFMLRLLYTGSAVTVTWPAGFKWPGGTAPTLSSGSNKSDLFTFFSSDYGSTWYATIVGQNL